MELYNHCSKYNDRVYKFPFAVNFKEFENVRLNGDNIPDQLRNIKRPIIGYVGGIHKWVDQGLVRNLAERHLECSFVFLGPIQTDVSRLSNLKNRGNWEERWQRIADYILPRKSEVTTKRAKGESRVVKLFD